MLISANPFQPIVLVRLAIKVFFGLWSWHTPFTLLCRTRSTDKPSKGAN